MLKCISILWLNMSIAQNSFITWTKRRFIMSYTFLTVKKSNFLLTSCRFVVGVLIIHTSNHQLNHCHAVAQNLYSQNNHLGMTCSKWIRTIYTKNGSTISMLDNWLNSIRSTFHNFTTGAKLWILNHYFFLIILINHFLHPKRNDLHLL